MRENVGSKLRMCKICSEPLNCFDGNLQTYQKRNVHAKCLREK
jgi:hypothetical protein